jgi:hypothetical protein
MAAIKGWVYLVFGAVMIASSQIGKIDAKTGHKPLWVFLFVGILFVIIGIGKYILKRDSKIEQKEPVPNPENQTQVMHPQHRTRHRVQHTQAHQSISQQSNQAFQQPVMSHSSMKLSSGAHHVQKASEQLAEHASIIACPLCGTRHYDYANYCMKCGTRMKGIRER